MTSFTIWIVLNKFNFDFQKILLNFIIFLIKVYNQKSSDLIYNLNCSKWLEFTIRESYLKIIWILRLGL